MAVKPSPKAARSSRLHTRFEPPASRALRLRDLALRHLLGHLTPPADGVPVAAHRRQVEPLVRGDMIDRNTAADGIDHSQLKKGIPARHRMSERSAIDTEHLQTSHF